MKVDTNITQRLEWLKERVKLAPHEEEYIAFQLKDIAQDTAEQVVNNFALDNVSKPLSDLKKLLAEMTIKLITTKPDCEEKHKLVRDIEIAKESINALK